MQIAFHTMFRLYRQNFIYELFTFDADADEVITSLLISSLEITSFSSVSSVYLNKCVPIQSELIQRVKALGFRPLNYYNDLIIQSNSSLL